MHLLGQIKYCMHLLGQIKYCMHLLGQIWYVGCYTTHCNTSTSSRVQEQWLDCRALTQEDQGSNALVAVRKLVQFCSLHVASVQSVV